MDNINNLILEAYYATLHEGIAENVYRRIKNDVNDQDIDLEEYKLSLDIIQRLLQSKKDKIGQDTLKSWNKQSTDITDVLKSLSELYSSEDSPKIRQKSNRNSGLKDLYSRALKAEKDDVIEIENKKDIMAGKHNLIMIKPLTKEASIDFGCDNWCTSNSRENAEMFDEYVTKGINNMLYIHLDPKQAKEMDLPKIKYTWAIRFDKERKIVEIEDMDNKGGVSVEELNKLLNSFGVIKGIESYLNYNPIGPPLKKANYLLDKGKEVPEKLINGISKDSEDSYNFAKHLLDKGKEVPEKIFEGISADSFISARYAIYLLEKNKEVPKKIIDSISKDSGVSWFYYYYSRDFKQDEEVIEKLIDVISRESSSSYFLAKHLLDMGKEVPEKIKKAAERYKK